MRTFLLVAITAVLLVPGMVFAEGQTIIVESVDQMREKMELREMELELEARDMELDFERQRRELELEARDMELDFERQRRELELAKMRGQIEAHNKAQQMDWHKKAQMKEKFAQGMDKHHGGKKGCGVFILIAIVVNVLLAVWTYKDIREKTNSSGIWIVVVLLTGLFGAIVYAIVRLGDLKQPQNT